MGKPKTPKSRKQLVLCNKIGISAANLEADNLKEINVDQGQFTNGLILELNRYCVIKKWPKDRCAKWVMDLTPLSLIPTPISDFDSYLLQVIQAIVSVQEQRTSLLHKKWYDQSEVLEKQGFSLPNPSPLNIETQFSVSHDENTVPSNDQCDGDGDLTPFTQRSTTNSAVTKDDIHTLNTITSQIKRKKSRLQRLENKITTARAELQALKSKIMHKTAGRYADKNVKRREMRMKNALVKSKSELKQVEDKNVRLTMDVSTLEDMIFDSDDKARREQKMKSHHRHKALNKESKLESEVKELKVDLTHAESQICDEPGDPIHVNLKNKDGSYTYNVRECVLELTKNEVAADKVAPVIKSVAQNIFNCSLEDVPKRQCVQNIVDEGQLIFKQYAQERMTKTSHYGIIRDGTSRQKVKVLTTGARLDTGEVLPFGFRRVANETAEVIKDTCVMELTEVAETNLIDSLGEMARQKNLEGFVEKLSFYCSDRAANEKLANKKLTEWRENVLEKCGSEAAKHEVHNFYCMAHVLLGFHSYGSKELHAVQKEYEKDGVLFGRDNVPWFLRFGKEKICVRVPRIASQLCGPVGDEKSGMQDKWLAFCEANHIKSTLEAYKDNRFNCMFATTIQTLHHREHILSTIAKIALDKKPNQKIESLRLDLEDGNVLAIMHAVAMIGAKVTGPFWELVTSGRLEYLNLYLPVQNLLSRLDTWLEDIEGLYHPDEAPIFPQFKPKDCALYRDVFNLSHHINRDLMRKAAIALVTGMKACVEKQLCDFLPGGKYGCAPSADELQRTAKSDVTNLPCERHFGLYDSSASRRRNATLHYHSSLLMLKSHGTKLLSFLRARTDRRELWARAPAQAKALRRKHKIEEDRQKAIIYDQLISGKKKKVPKKATKTKAKKRNQNSVTSSSQDPVAIVVSINDWVGVAYENDWYPGHIIRESDSSGADDKRFVIDFMHPCQTAGHFKKPKSDIAEVEFQFIFHRMLVAPYPISGGRLFKIAEREYKALESKYAEFKRKTWNE